MKPLVVGWTLQPKANWAFMQGYLLEEYSISEAQVGVAFSLAGASQLWTFTVD